MGAAAEGAVAIDLALSFFSQERTGAVAGISRFRRDRFATGGAPAGSGHEGLALGQMGSSASKAKAAALCAGAAIALKGSGFQIGVNFPDGSDGFAPLRVGCAGRFFIPSHGRRSNRVRSPMRQGLIGEETGSDRRLNPLSSARRERGHRRKAGCCRRRLPFWGPG